jgi:methane monooxygenase PmoA-like
MCPFLRRIAAVAPFALAVGCGGGSAPPPPPGGMSGSGGTGGGPGVPDGPAGAGGAGGSMEPPPATDAAPAPTPAPGGTGQQITVKAGDADRESTIVSFPWQPADAGKSFLLRDAQGARLPLQVDEQGRATFVLPALKAGGQAVFTVEEGSAPAAASAVKEADGVKLNLGTATVLRYQTTGKLPAGIGQNYLRGGYIHPLFTPGGLLVTDDYPGDHRHHHGIWSAWAHSTFEGRQMDFWNMGGGSAKVDFDSLQGTWDGPVHAGLRTHHVFVDRRAPGGGKTALNEEWFVTLYHTHDGAPPYFLFDIDSTQVAASMSPVMLENYLYGGFAFRGSAQWRSGATFLTSEGKNRQAGDNSTGKWCYIGGPVGNKIGGYAVLGHPSNFRAPQPMRLNPTDPYFSFSPVKMGGFPIVPGKPYPSRFRFVVTDGDPDKALLDRLWNDYARPPEVTVQRAP